MTRIRLSICAVWSESSKDILWVAKEPKHLQIKSPSPQWLNSYSYNPVWYSIKIKPKQYHDYKGWSLVTRLYSHGIILGVTSLYSILVLFYWIIKQDYKNRYLVTGYCRQSVRWTVKTDQTAMMVRLIWVFSGRTCNLAANAQMFLEVRMQKVQTNISICIHAIFSESSLRFILATSGSVVGGRVEPWRYLSNSCISIILWYVNIIVSTINSYTIVKKSL